MPYKSKAQALAMAGQRADLAPHLAYPGINPERSYQEYYSLYDRLWKAAVGCPIVESTIFAPPIRYFEDFLHAFEARDLALASESDPTGVFSEVADRGKYLITLVGTQGEFTIGTPIDGAANASAQGGWGTFITSDDSGNDLICAQMNGESWKLATAKPLYFETRFAIKTITESEVFIGLADTGTDLYVDGVGVTNHVGFMLDNDGNLDFSIDEGATQHKVDTLVNFVDGSLATLETANVVHRCGFYWDGAGTIYVYVDGVLTNTIVDEGVAILVPDATCLSIGFQLENTTTTAETMWIDYIMCVQAR